MEELDLILETAKEQMQGTVDHLEVAFDKLRAGKASPAMLNSVRVDYYGSLTPLSQIANVNTPDAMTISVQPWEKNLIYEIEKAIINANLGFAPSNNGDTIIISIPPVTEERRKELVKMAKADMEHAKVSLRNARKDANTALKNVKEASEDMVKDYETRVQGLTDKYSKKLEEALTKKEGEIMKV
ncbi:ribosome recycling factor [Algoriella xinjiangensis]|uniref:Ribosome-recycling factor n=1 Tax=Algoriella xinjiangensis TaxID=684065 RepID=A0A1I4XX45_9FLAO|nr:MULTISPECIES: ribosome recycling factor [Algoriella]MBO6211479.1 ribosome recycling factor [Algoriella sp.]SFN30458.1 ribosome recycling factor [Algoriella xinjiangensis]VDH15408.1 Ribosome-releasing factor [Algoriella xinjiangensis]